MGDTNKKVLIYGYGNPGRLDDGLGPAFAAELEKRDLDEVTVDSNYQLFVEDAATIAAHDVVVFVDADVAGPEPFHFDRVIPKAHMSFSSHSISTDALVAMACDLLGSKADAFVLGIRGYEFNEFGEVLSSKAKANLQAAVEFMLDALKDRDFAKYVDTHGTKSDEA